MRSPTAICAFLRRCRPRCSAVSLATYSLRWAAHAWNYDRAQRAWLQQYENVFPHQRRRHITTAAIVTDDQLQAGDRTLVLMRLRRSMPSVHIDALELAIKHRGPNMTKHPRTDPREVWCGDARRS